LRDSRWGVFAWPPVTIDGKLLDIPAVRFLQKLNVYYPAQIM
jgi:hypothetical protein